MASSQVEIAASASFGCILRDQNRGDRFTNTFQRSLKDYLLQTCISNSPPNENSLNSGSWVRNPNNNENNSCNEVGSPNSKRNARVLERWAKAGNMVASIDGPNHERSENSPTQLDSPVKITNPGGVSSLVQRWKGFTETPQIQNPKGNNGHNAAASSPVSTPRSNSENVPPPNDVEHEGNTTNSLGSFVLSNRSEAFDKSADKRFDTPSIMTEDSFIDWESVQGGQDSADGGERERLRVADVIRKLTSENQMQGCLVSWKNEQGTSISSPSASPHPCELPLPQLRTAVSDQTGEQRGSFLSSSPVVSSPRLRGRQAFNDLLMQMERDRHRELDGLVERRAVSKFSHRGRIQSLLRLRFLRREAEARNDNHRQSLRREAPIGAQQQHSHGMEVRPQEEISCLGGDANDEINLCRERVGAQQRFGGLEEATVGPWQHSIPAVTRFQQHSFSKEVRDLETAQGEAAVEVRQQSHGTVLEGSRTRQPSAVVLLREKFNIRVENDASNPKTPRGVVVNSNAEVKNSSSSNQAMEEPQPHDQNLESCSMEDIHKEASPSLDTLRQGTSDEVCNIDSKESDAAPLTASNGWEEDVSAEEQESSNPEQTTTNEDMINCDWQEQESDDQQLVGIDHDWISDAFSRPWSEWDEQEANDEQNIETNNDWVTDISRPRSDWEVLREVRYKEMLDPYLDNGDIRQLLERRSVSTFLSSNLRETMDQLMISRAERFPQSTGNEQEEEDGFRNRLEQLMLSRTQRQENKGSNHQEDGGRNMEEHQEDEEQDVEEDQEEQDNDDDHEDEDEDEEQEEEDDDEESPITCQHSEVGDNVDQVADGVRTWSHDGDHEVSDDSDEVASQQSQSSQATYRGSQFCSFTNHSSIEMELIYDLRRHMVELQHEMSKLRKSLKSCVNMQSKLQRSIKHEVADAVSLSVRRVGKESLNGVPRKRSCVVCYEMQVDSLLYRCGHMCTCFKCAHELQWSSGKCPICRAPIVDVVRAYANDS